MGTGRNDEADRELALPCLLVLGVLGVVALVIGTVLPSSPRQLVLVLGLAGVVLSVVGVLTLLARTAHDRGQEYPPREYSPRSR